MFKRCEKNPIVVPGKYEWRKAVTFNPAVIYDDGKFYMLERAAAGLTPFNSCFGLLESEDGVNFTHVKDTPVVTTENLLGWKYGSIQDPRLVKIDNLFYLLYAARPYSYSLHPTGTGHPSYFMSEYPGWNGDMKVNMSRSGIAVSEDLINWKQVGFTTPEGLDDRDNILFPEKINGKFVLLRRPQRDSEGNLYKGYKPSIWISYSEDLVEWTEPVLIAEPKYEWEGEKIGGSTPPLRTDKGWLVIYHGVDETSAYRTGAILLDINNPEKVIGRTKVCIMEPEEYYEKVGLVIPNVIFPTGNVIIDDELYLYYGCCDTSIGMAKAKVDDILNAML